MSSSRHVLALVVTLAAAFALGSLGASGCANPPCIRHSDCNVGLICGEGGVCVMPPDAAPEDADGGDGIDATPRPDATPRRDAAPELDGSPADADTTLEESDAS
jgi:hypothetical protein